MWHSASLHSATFKRRFSWQVTLNVMCQSKDTNIEWRNIVNAYIPVLIWFLSAMICLYIARTRHVKITLFRKLVVIFLGPFAIPLAFFSKTENTIEEK